MIDIVSKAFTYIIIIIIAFLLKKKGVVPKELCSVFMKLLLWITLPCAVISSFSIEGDVTNLLFLPLSSIIINLLMMLLGRTWGKREGKAKSDLYMINFTGYNIGAFSLPFVQGFLGPSALAAVCLFDAGNSLVFNGVLYAYTLNQDGTKTSFLNILKKMFSSLTFDAYMLMLALSFLGIKLPSFAINMFSVAGSANPFIAMFIVGLLLDFEAKPSFIKSTVIILSVRYALALILSIITYYLLPFSLEIRQGLVLVLFAPIPALSSGYTESCKSESDVSSFASSCSFVISIVFITLLVMLFGLS